MTHTNLFFNSKSLKGSKMIINVPSKTKEKLKLINSEIDKLTLMRQTIYDTVCDLNSYSGNISFNEAGDIVTEEVPETADPEVSEPIEVKE